MEREKDGKKNRGKKGKEKQKRRKSIMRTKKRSLNIPVAAHNSPSLGLEIAHSLPSSPCLRLMSVPWLFPLAPGSVSIPLLSFFPLNLSPKRLSYVRSLIHFLRISICVSLFHHFYFWLRLSVPYFNHCFVI